MLACGYAVQHCASGEIGRRAGFRFQCLRTCGFKSRLAHQIKKTVPVLMGTVSSLSGAPASSFVCLGPKRTVDSEPRSRDQIVMVLNQAKV